MPAVQNIISPFPLNLFPVFFFLGILDVGLDVSGTCLGILDVGLDVSGTGLGGILRRVWDQTSEALA